LTEKTNKYNENENFNNNSENTTMNEKNKDNGFIIPEWFNNKNIAQAMLRWRLILGKFAQESLFNIPQLQLSSNEILIQLGELLDLTEVQGIDDSLSFLYDREYGMEEEYNLVYEDYTMPKTGEKENGSKFGHGLLTIPKWIENVKNFFPKNAAKELEKDAIKKYKIYDILSDEDILDQIEPDIEIVKLILTFKKVLSPRVYQKAKSIVRKVVKELEKKLLLEINSAINGVKNRFQSSPIKIAKNLDFKKTIKCNLKNYDDKTKKLYIDNVFFYSRIFKKKDWNVIICIDQSGSMTDSIIHSAIMGSIFASVKTLKTNLVVFDTEVVDLSDKLDDIIEVLFSIQLGGGTNIGKAVKYCQGFITNPLRTIFILITDFFEGYEEEKLINYLKEFKESGITMLGLPALDYNSVPSYNKHLASILEEQTNMRIQVATPKELAEIIFDIINQKP